MHDVAYLGENFDETACHTLLLSKWTTFQVPYQEVFDE
jgi:hypothetical protein